jgi:NAD(P)H-hydrate repair Nnr-like enzyme with NAD(P)H-hydrate dehydratase domain
MHAELESVQDHDGRVTTRDLARWLMDTGFGDMLTGLIMAAVSTRVRWYRIWALLLRDPCGMVLGQKMVFLEAKSGIFSIVSL